MDADLRLVSERFPRANKYHPDWAISSASGANALWLSEWLAEAMELRPGMRVLDLGCGRAMSSIFLHREFGVQVWAVDLWFDVTQNLRRVRDAGIEDGVFPIHANARALPFGCEFFDAIVCIDAYMYFGTDDMYLNYLSRFVKPGGQMGTAMAGLMQEIDGGLPEHLREWWEPGCWSLHSPAWWRRHWERTGAVEIERADAMPEGWQRWLEWQRATAPGNVVEIKALEADQGRYFGYVRFVGRRRAEAKLEEPIVSVQMEYTKAPLLRGQQ
jgi:SAM-dependent methyltransferase